MTAPCRPTGKLDASGHALVQCQCPVFEGPFELGQAGVPCDANALTPPAPSTGGKKPFYVWSAAHNPKKNHGPIDPPAGACVPDLPGGKGCPLYDPAATYPITKGSPLCRQVCKAYRSGVRQSTRAARASRSPTVAMPPCAPRSASARPPPPPAPLRTAGLLTPACGDLDQQSGIKAILALETANNCSCCASQVCGCDDPGKDIDAATQTLIGELNAAQVKLGITPQCEINGTLCGRDAL